MELFQSLWLSHKNEDNYDVPKTLDSLSKFSISHNSMTGYLNNIEPNTKIDFSKLEKMQNYEKELIKVDYLKYMKDKQKNFFMRLKTS